MSLGKIQIFCYLFTGRRFNTKDFVFFSCILRNYFVHLQPNTNNNLKRTKRMKTTKFLLTALLAIMFAPEVWADDGDTFTVQTSEGVTMTFQVVSEALKTCQVGTGSVACCIDKEYTGAVTVPATANEYAVKQIGDYAFCGCAGLNGIDIPNSIQSIGACAFKGCENIKSLYINKLI